ncbi:MAG: signal peptide peptidase SppA [Candidatus Gastranaerophilales bacterium]|nr:signal peptide peptidase SppA [Candidatus Gastranaerophilales bacterium]
MKKNVFAIIIISLCTLCLIVGLVTKNTNGEKYTNDSPKGKMSNAFKKSTNKIALVSLNGVIDSNSKTNAFSNEFTAQSTLKSLKMAGKDNEIRGIIIKMNTPGGTVGMSQCIYNEVLRIKKTKPVVVVMEDVAASGGYYIASAADRIFAMDGTLTGSIGVIFSTMNYHQLLTEKLAITPNVIKSGKYKDIGSPYRAMSSEDRKLLEGIVDDSYSQFISAIEKGRVTRNDKYTAHKQNLADKTLRKYADGRIFTGRQAYKLGFIDSLGDLTDAQNAIGTMASEKFGTGKDVILVPYTKTSTFAEAILGTTESIFTPKDYIESFIPTSIKLSKRPLYLWE